MKVSIVIPCFNEEETVEKIINRVKRIPIEKEVIVVDDGSTDRSFEKIKGIKGIKVIRHEKNKGKGAAIKTGIKYSTGDIFIVQDADLELNPEEIPNIINPIVKGEAEVVYGLRELGNKGKRSLLFYFGGKLVTFLTNFLYGTKLTDAPCGYKAFKTDIIRNIEIKGDGFEFEPEITAKIARRGIKIKEVPVSYIPRIKGKKINWKDGLKAIWTLVYWRFKFPLFFCM